MLEKKPRLAAIVQLQVVPAWGIMRHFMTTEGFSYIPLAFFTLLSSRVLFLMIKSLRPLLLAGVLLPLAFSATAAPINNTLPPNVAQALQKAKLQNTALSLVMLPLNGPGTPTVFNATSR